MDGRYDVTKSSYELRRCERSNRKGTGETRTVGAMPLGSGSVPFGTSHSNRSHARTRTRASNSRLHTRIHTCVYSHRVSAPITEPPFLLGLREFVRVDFAEIERNVSLVERTHIYICMYIVRIVLLCKQARLDFDSHSVVDRRRDLKL